MTATMIGEAVDRHLGPDDAAFHAILDVLRARTGIDFSRYRPATVRRRVLNRMISAHAETFEDYLHVLRAHEGEAGNLLERVTIKVSRFYRNAVTFDALRAQVIPELAAQAAGRPLRIWSAGCGCGEEPYTLAMLLEEANVPGRIEATDVDARALHLAQEARYAPALLTELPKTLADRYLESRGETCTVIPALRDRVHFSFHDLTSDMIPSRLHPPFDLVCCRNVLIYFDRVVQERALGQVRRAVRSGGFLCLGEAEWPSPVLATGLQALDHRTRIFRALDVRALA